MKISPLTRLLDLIAPRKCHVCGCRLSATETTVCTPCNMHLPRTGYWLSPVDNPMARLLLGQVDIVRAASFIYHHPHSESAAMVYAMKYANRPDTAVAMGAMAAGELAAEGFFDGIDLIVPVPLSRSRQRARGYNQSERLARGISDVTGLPVETGAVMRTRFDGSQTEQTRQGRHDNVAGLFRLRRGGRLTGRHVLLVDDVVTSGATLIACAKTIGSAGNVRISVMTLAMTHS